jgi:VTC domain
MLTTATRLPRVSLLTVVVCTFDIRSESILPVLVETASRHGNCLHVSLLHAKTQTPTQQVRWYGKRDGDPEAKLYVERKVHHDAMSGEESYKVSQLLSATVTLLAASLQLR